MLSESILSMIFFIVRFGIYIACIFYLRAIGEKIDHPGKSTHWGLLIIPVYIIQIFLLLYCLLHCFSYGRSKCEIFLIFISCMAAYVPLVLGFVILVIKLENGAHGLSFFVVPALMIFSSLYLFIHNAFVIGSRYKEIAKV